LISNMKYNESSPAKMLKTQTRANILLCLKDKDFE